MRSDLSAVQGVSEVETNLDDKTCTFQLEGDLDVDQLLNELAASNNKMKDWSHNN